MSEKEVKNRWFEIGKCKFNIDKPLAYKEYAIGLIVSVNNIARPDNEDGSIDIVYKSKACGELVINNEFNKMYIKADKKSQSQKLHGQIMLEERLPGCEKMDDEEYYKYVMQKIRHYYSMIMVKIPDWDKAGL